MRSDKEMSPVAGEATEGGTNGMVNISNFTLNQHCAPTTTPVAYRAIAYELLRSERAY